VKPPEDTATCPICTENAVEVQTTCNHHYCKDCLTQWLSSHETCPYCRETIDKVFRIVCV
jgi:RNA polymerase subunit RPABC4/transcription elongation factor Spt4